MKQHKISLATAILMNINIMVGSGILVGPASIAAISGNASFLSWLMVAFLFLPIVLSTVQLSRMFPGAGGFYAYAKEGLGELAGYWSGWMYIVGYTFASVLETIALRKTLIHAFNFDWPWLVESPIYFNLIAAVVFTIINLLSLRMLGKILNSATISKLIPLLVLILLIPFVFNPSFTVTGAELAALPMSLPLAIFGYFGFEYCTSISHHIENSERNAPLAILIGFFTTALLYTLFHFGALNLMGTQELVAQGAPAFAEFITLPIPFLRGLLGFLIPVASAITLFGAAIGLINANATMIHTMAEKNLFRFSPVFTQTSSNGRPWVAVILQGVALFIIASCMSYATVDLVSAIDVVGALCVLGVFLAFVLPFISLMVVQRRDRKHRHIALTAIALTVVAGLIVYVFTLVAPTMQERLIWLTPLLAAITLGAIIKK